MQPSNDPAQSQSQSAGVTPGQNGLIFRYERAKRLTRWLLIFFILSGITYTILTARSQRLPVSAISESNLGQKMAVLGNMVVLSSMSDDKQEILFSRDGGKLFYRTGNTWKIQDTSLIVAIAPDTATILALEKNGLLHFKRGSENRFYSHQIILPVKDSVVSGVCFIPGTDSFYVYGRFPGIIELNWKNPYDFRLRHTPGVRQTISMAVDQEKNVVCILENLGGISRQLYYGKTIESLEMWVGEYINFDNKPVNADSLRASVDSNYKSVIDSSQTVPQRRLPNATRKSVKRK